MNTPKVPRLRIAPSPTGDPHVGTAYVALFNSVYAHKNNGQFVLRIEDTDQTRSTLESEQQILAALKWLGLHWDEGPDCGGNFGPYRQSERLDIYKRHVDQLLKNKSAYRCFCTSDRLEKVREQQKQAKQQTKYDRHCLNLSNSELDALLQKNTPFVVRLKIPDVQHIAFKDELRGEISIESAQIDDQILLKSDGFPTYHLANVVDDHLMQITHVMRAEEWISSTPKHVCLYQAFGWEQPVWIHLSLLRNSDRSKISKRKNPVSLNYYKSAGILPEALINFLALMGWNHQQASEFFDLQTIQKSFDISQLTVGSPVFDLTKLNWLNQQYIQKMNQADFVKTIYNQVIPTEYLSEIFPLMNERLERFSDFFDKAQFFFVDHLNFSKEDLCSTTKLDVKDLAKIFSELMERFDAVKSWNSTAVHDLFEEVRRPHDYKAKDFYMPIRIALTGRKDSPPLPETIVVLGKDRIRSRLRSVLEKLA